MISFWEKDHWFSTIDFLIIGAGFTGLFSALALRKKYPDARILVVERNALPLGASTKNAGFACYGSVGELVDDLEHENLDAAVARAVRRYEGLQKLRAAIPDAECDYHAAGGYELFRPDETSFYKTCCSYISVLNNRLKQELGFAPYATVDVKAFGFSAMEGAIRIAQEGMLQPAKAIAFLEKRCVEQHISVLHGLEITGLNASSSGVVAHTPTFTCEATKVIVATNAFAAKLLPALRVVPARGQILLTEPLPDLPFSGTFHMNKGYYYFRNVGNRVLLGGARHLDFNGETTTEIALNAQLQQHLETVLRTTLLPGKPIAIAQRWSGIMGFGQKGEKEPIVREVLPNVVAAVRLGGMGVALSAQVADEAVALL